ncbi:MAG: hypothetical protein HQM15_00255 [Deltaproteobacteria bacterium]|nr:hypothetical protein [Deltaproteobacteria bacterium]
MTQVYLFSRQRSLSGQAPIQVAGGLPETNTQLRVVDNDGNQIFDERDSYFFQGSQGGGWSLSAEQGLRLLNVFTDPRNLFNHHETLKIAHQGFSPASSERWARLNSFSQIRDLNPYERDLGFFRREAYFWSPSGAVNYRFLSGEQSFGPQENLAFSGLVSGLSGIWNALNANMITHRLLVRTTLFVGIFMLGSRAIHPLFMWQMYMSNYLNMNIGSMHEGSVLREQLRILEHQNPQSSNRAERVRGNIQMGLARSSLAEDHAYWGITWPFALFVGGFADSNFRKIWPAPWRMPRLGPIKEYFSIQSSSSLAYIRRGPSQFLLAGLAAYGLYELALNWNAFFGGAPESSSTGKLMAIPTALPIVLFILDLMERGRPLPWGVSNWIQLHSYSAGKIGLGIGVALAATSILGYATGYFDERHSPVSRFREFFSHNS